MLFGSISLKKGAWHWNLHQQASRIGFPEPEYFVRSSPYFCLYFWLTILYTLLAPLGVLIGGIVFLFREAFKLMFMATENLSDARDIHRTKKVERKAITIRKDVNLLTRDNLEDLLYYMEMYVGSVRITMSDLGMTPEEAHVRLDVLRAEELERDLRNVAHKKFWTKVGSVLLFPMAIVFYIVENIVAGLRWFIEQTPLAVFVKWTKRIVMLLTFGAGGALVLYLYWLCLHFAVTHEAQIVTIFFFIVKWIFGVALLLGSTVVFIFIWLRHFLIMLFDHLDREDTSLPIWLVSTIEGVGHITGSFFKLLWKMITGPCKFFYIGFMSWKGDNCPAIEWDD